MTIDRDAGLRSVLKRRAAQLARRATDLTKRELFAKVAVVAVGAERFGIPVEGLREIVPLPAITPLPSLPPWLLGMVQVRGELLGVLDLSVFLGLASGQKNALVVLEGEEGPFGLTVSEVIDFRHVYVDELSEGLAVRNDRPIKGTTKDLLAVLDVSALRAEQLKSA